jgi:hypothetical protein
MTLHAALGLYLALGIVGMLIGIGADGPRGLGATAAAWALGLITFIRPPRRPRVAEIAISPKISRDRNLWLGAMPFRMTAVLLAAAMLYSWFGSRLGMGFWFALIGFYLAGLALSVAWTVSELHRGD